MVARSGPKMVEVSTTMRPDKTLKVTELERDSMSRLGILKGDKSAPAEKPKEN